MQTLLRTLLAEYETHFSRLEGATLRSAHFPDLPGKIKVAIGMRRVGKTYFLWQAIQNRIQQQKVPIERILYLNFEDDRLLPCTQEKLAQLLEAFYQIYPENYDHPCYFFLDEIQNVENWALVIRRFQDSRKVDIYLSGSSAKLLSKELATALRGRSIAVEIWPYSFEEYLHAYDLKLKEGPLNQRNYDRLFQYLDQYLIRGGFPETIAIDEIYRRQILQDYVELVILRDIVERYQIKNISLLKSLIQNLIKNNACLFSVNKFVNDAKSQGFLSSKNTVYDYLMYLEDAYLIFPVSLFSESLRQVQSNPRKIYVIDTGLTQAYTLSLNKNYGHLFENMVFLDFKRQGAKIYYYLTQERYEVDFLIEDRQGHRKLYQVCWNTEDPDTLARETRALEAAKKELKIPGELITPRSYLEGL